MSFKFNFNVDSETLRFADPTTDGTAVVEAKTRKPRAKKSSATTETTTTDNTAVEVKKTRKPRAPKTTDDQEQQKSERQTIQLDGSSIETEASSSTETVEALSLEQLLGRASEAVTNGNVAEAIGDLTAAIGMAGNDPRAYGLRADLYEHEKRYNEAIADYKKVLELIPESIPCLSSMADCYASMDHTDMAIKLFSQILTIEPTFIPALGALGDLEIKRGDLSRAFDHFKRIMAIEPGNISGMLGMGHVALKQNSLEAAKKLYVQVIKLGKERGIQSLHTVTTGTTEGPRLKKSPEHNPVYGACLCLSNIYDMEGSLDKSLDVLETALEVHPSSAFALSMKASNLLRQKRPQDSLVCAEAAMATGNVGEFTKLIYADCLFDLARYKDSIQVYKAVAADMLERDLPDEASTRVSLLHNMLVACITRLEEVSAIEIDLSMEVDREAISSVVGTMPENIQDLSKRARALAKLVQAFPAPKDADTQAYVDAMVDALHQIALTANEALQIRHNPKIEIDRERILEPLEDILFSYYESLASTFATSD
eukprot:gene3806-4387_t